MQTADPLAAVDILLARGRAAEAVALIERRVAQNDADALFRKAMWLLIGSLLERNLDEARALLHRAVEAGHVGATSTAISLIANGSGGTPDWPAALALLRRLARIDSAAASQIALIEDMTVDADGNPLSTPTPEPMDRTGTVLRFPGLLTPAECAQVARVAADLLEPTMVIDPATGRQVPHPIRTSDGAVIGPTREDLVIRAINRRLAAISNTDITQGEALTVLRYNLNQQYRIHVDALPNVANQRVATVLIYLNEGFAGGETVFPEVGVTVTPRGGDAVLFRNTLSDGRPDPRMRHAGLPVTRGTKWLATRWIRARPLDPWNLSTAA